MRHEFMSAAMLALLLGCSNDTGNQVQADLPVDHGSVAAGSGNSVTMQGNALPLSGDGAIALGQKLPAAMLASLELKAVELADSGGRVRIISVVPSLDTPTCERQTHLLSEDNDGLDQQVQLITVSMDLPFAQARFARDAKIDNVTFLSDYKAREFARHSGLLIEPLAMLARAVIVTDQDDVVRHLQVVPEITALPDMPAAMKAARALL